MVLEASYPPCVRLHHHHDYTRVGDVSHFSTKGLSEKLGLKPWTMGMTRDLAESAAASHNRSHDRERNCA